MERTWLDSYTEGTPHDIDPDTYPSLVAIIDEAIARFPDRPAFDNLGVRITFAELDRLAKAREAKDGVDYYSAYETESAAHPDLLEAAVGNR